MVLKFGNVVGLCGECVLTIFAFVRSVCFRLTQLIEIVSRSINDIVNYVKISSAILWYVAQFETKISICFLPQFAPSHTVILARLALN